VRTPVAAVAAFAIEATVSHAGPRPVVSSGAVRRAILLVERPIVARFAELAIVIPFPQREVRVLDGQRTM